MKILHVLDHSVPLHSGYSFRTLALLTEQRRMGWVVEAVTSTKHIGARVPVEDVEGFRFHRTDAAAAPWWRLPVLNQWAVVRDTARRLREVIAAFRPDIVHAHSPCLDGMAALAAAGSQQIPVAYEVRAFWEDAAVDHGSTADGSVRYRLTRALETSVMRRVQAVTTICEGLRGDIVGRGIAPDRVTVIPNAVDVERFPVIGKPDLTLKSQLKLQQSTVIGFIGSFYAYEGLDVLLHSLPQLLRSQPDVRLLLVGGGPEDSRLRALVSELGLDDRVCMPGRVPHHEVARYYSVIDLLVFPRKSMRLTELVTPLKPLESMAQGKLVVASNVGGHRELIVDNETGFLFPPDSPLALATTMSKLLRHRERWPQIQRAARDYVARERTWQLSASRYRGVYELMLAASH